MPVPQLHNKNGGFTLVESLIVFSVFMLLATVTAFMVRPQYQYAEKQSFLTQLKADLLYGQQYAISHQHEVTVNFIPEQHYYCIRDNYLRPFIVERTYPDNITLSPGSMPLYFKYLPDGNVSKFGNFYITINGKEYHFTILIGKGRFYVPEE